MHSFSTETKATHKVSKPSASFWVTSLMSHRGSCLMPDCLLDWLFSNEQQRVTCTSWFNRICFRHADSRAFMIHVWPPKYVMAWVLLYASHILRCPP